MMYNASGLGGLGRIIQSNGNDADLFPVEESNPESGRD